MNLVNHHAPVVPVPVNVKLVSMATLSTTNIAISVVLFLHTQLMCQGLSDVNLAHHHVMDAKQIVQHVLHAGLDTICLVKNVWLNVPHPVTSRL